MFIKGDRVRYLENGPLVSAATVLETLSNGSWLILQPDPICPPGKEPFVRQKVTKATNEVWAWTDFAGPRARLREAQNLIECQLSKLDYAERESRPIRETLAGLPATADAELLVP